MKRIISGIMLLLLLCSIPISVLAVSVPTFVPGNYIYDIDDLLTLETEKKVNAMLVDLQKKTTIEFLVYSTKSLEDLSPNEYAAKAGNKWGIGKKDKDNGILLLVYEKGPNVYIATGYGIEEILTDRKCGFILDTFFVPYRKANDYDSAVINTVQAIINHIAKEQMIEGVDSGLELTEEKIAELEEKEARKVMIWLWIIGILILLILLDLIIDTNNKPRGAVVLIILEILGEGGSSSRGSSGGGLGGGSFGGGGAGR